MSDPAYWHEKWQHNSIGFHQSDVNAALREHWNELGLRNGDVVLVPLCGKSRDMLWLRDRGQHVLGVELSALAVEAFFAENAGHTDNIDIITGDFFALTANDVTNVTAVYDRAALIALPNDMRRRYADHLMQILPTNTQMLLITLDRDQADNEGPPFTVTTEEVHALYGAENVELLAYTELNERVYRCVLSR